jgi:hypothetical protein
MRDGALRVGDAAPDLHAPLTQLLRTPRAAGGGGGGGGEGGEEEGVGEGGFTTRPLRFADMVSLSPSPSPSPGAGADAASSRPTVIVASSHS